MTELVVCIGLVWGMCGHVQIMQMKDEATCQAQAAALMQKPNITYAICRVPKDKAGEK